jgi:hypothetical protein
MSKRQQYVPPIPWERFDAMHFAVYRQTYEDQKIDKATLAEIIDAVMRLRAIYQTDLRKKTLPNRRTSDSALLNAAIASWLMKLHPISAKQAMEAATGQYSNIDDAKTVAKTLKNRQRQLRDSGHGRLNYLVVLRRVRIATRRLRQTGVIRTGVI